ncbi:hypothetical protein B1R38_06065 [Bacillus cereus]|uniref:hypothetical protein n=1 Tax=Bacillus cereus TaxID=1396 RepID=UPI000D650F7F|nr:hypothetical protein [Bacillus cereus]PWE74347.1 hypothetical protein B1R38_06065 [Bacillus cereus]
MIRNDYIFRIHDTINNKIYLEKIFSNVTYKEAIYKAENLLTGNKKLKDKFHKDLEISISLMNNLGKKKGDTICYKMNWNKPFFSNGGGYFKGWNYYLNNNIVVAPKEDEFSKTHLAPLCFTTIFVISLVISIIMIKQESEYLLFVTFLNFLVGLIYSGIGSIIRSNFNDLVKGKKGVYIFNVEIDLPIWIATTATLINLIEKGIVKYIPSGLVGIICLTVSLLLIKIVISIGFDLDKLHLKSLKGEV